MLHVDYEELSAELPTIFVNTSCEHVADFAGWRQRVPAGARLVLQSNDHWGCSEHVNCVPDVEAFERQSHLSQIDFRGTLQLARFRRFMDGGLKRRPLRTSRARSRPRIPWRPRDE